MNCSRCPPFRPSMGPQRKLVDYSKSKAELPCNTDFFPDLTNPSNSKEEDPDCQEFSGDGVYESLPSSPVKLSRPSRCPAKPQRERRVLRVSSLNKSDISCLAIHEQSGIFSTERGVRSSLSFSSRDGSYPSLPSDSPSSISRKRGVSCTASFDSHNLLCRSSSLTSMKPTREGNGNRLKRQESANLKSPRTVFDELASSVHSVSPQRKSLCSAESCRQISVSPTDREKIKREFSRRSSRRQLFPEEEEEDSIPSIPTRGVLRMTSSQKQIHQLALCDHPQKPERQTLPRTRTSKTLRSAPMRSTSDQKMMNRLYEDLSRASFHTELSKRNSKSKVPERATSDGESLMALHLELRRANLVHRASSRQRKSSHRKLEQQA